MNFCYFIFLSENYLFCRCRYCLYHFVFFRKQNAKSSGYYCRSQNYFRKLKLRFTTWTSARFCINSCNIKKQTKYTIHIYTRRLRQWRHNKLFLTNTFLNYVHKWLTLSWNIKFWKCIFWEIKVGGIKKLNM